MNAKHEPSPEAVVRESVAPGRRRESQQGATRGRISPAESRRHPVQPATFQASSIGGFLVPVQAPRVYKGFTLMARDSSRSAAPASGRSMSPSAGTVPCARSAVKRLARANATPRWPVCGWPAASLTRVHRIVASPIFSPWIDPFAGSNMARKPNYGFEKRRKELERKQKQDAKLLRRQEEASNVPTRKRARRVNQSRRRSRTAAC